MKYLWFGMCSSETEQEKIVKNGGRILSASVSQNALLNGLESFGVSFDTINAYNLPPYPQFKQKKVMGNTWSRNSISSDVSVTYYNFKYISHFFKTNAIKKAAKKWAKAQENEEVTVFIYSMHSPFISGAVQVKKIIPKSKIVLIIPDLPQYMDLAMSPLKKILKAFDWLKLKKQMTYVDKYILYSKHMANFLGLKDGSWTVMEGSFDPSSVVSEEAPKSTDKISVMYSGVVDLRYGIPELLDAMELLDDRFELWITGGGNAEALIKERAEKDARIKYFGFLPSRKDLLLKQKQATMLISTRRPDEPASAYCFPSKLFEYMISGNPVLSCRIGGIPDEYFEYLTEMKSTSPTDIAEAIQRIAEMPSNVREQLGEKSKQFVLEQKNNVAQAKKILDFVNEV